MTWLLFLHLEIDRHAMYPWQWRHWQNVQQYMQNANLNSGTPIFKIRILAQCVCHDLLKTPHFKRKTFSFQNTYWTLKFWNEHSICVKLVAIDLNVKIYTTIQCKFLWILKLRVSEFGKATQTQLMEFRLADFCYRWLIDWPIWECE